MKKFLVSILILLVVAFSFGWVRAEDAITAEINQIKRDLDSLTQQLQGKEANYQKLNSQLQDIKSRIGFLEQEIIKKGQEVEQGEKVLEYQKQLLNERARSYYKNLGKNPDSLLTLFVSENISQSLENFFYQKSLVNQDKDTIIKIVLYIKNLEEKKASLESEKTQLAGLKKSLDQQSLALSGEITSTRQKIAQLSARQQNLIAQKLAGLNISRSANSAGRCDSDLTNGRDPGFSPKFALFTYGVPNRIGMNQWGAKGRADSGQNYDTILRAYYNFDDYQNFDTNLNINVDGYGSYSLEEYVKRIYEVPGDWPSEVLKAQAVAARSYVLAYTDNGNGSICATENCQVFKSDPKGGAWEQAVNDTAGKAMIKNGKPIKAWFSSTHGGYIFSSGEIGWSSTDWTKHGIDAPNGYGNLSDLDNNAYDRSSPWFYCDWGSRSEYNKTAWLKPNELADIVNVILLAKSDSSVIEHLYQLDKPNPAGTDTWDGEKVKSELRSRGGSPNNNIDNASVGVDFGGGRTTSVNLNGDGGSNSFDAKEFKDWFNLRAPANIQIVGPLFNVEKR